MKELTPRQAFNRAVLVHIKNNPGCTRNEIRTGLGEIKGSVLDATCTLHKHKLIREKGRPSQFWIEE